MVVRTIFRMAWVAIAFLIAALASLAVLFALGGIWAGDALRAAAPNDPLVRDGAPIFGLLLFARTVGPALTALPALIAVVAGEVMRVRSWMYYVLAGGLSLAAIPVLAAPETAELSSIVASHAMTIFATAGFAGGRLLAARRRARLGRLLLGQFEDAVARLEVEGGDSRLKGKARRRPALRHVPCHGLSPSVAAMATSEPGHQAVGRFLALGIVNRGFVAILGDHWFNPLVFTARTPLLSLGRLFLRAKPGTTSRRTRLNASLPRTHKLARRFRCSTLLLAASFL